VRPGRICGLVLLAACANAACASVNQPTLAGRFIRQGTPAVDLGGPPPAGMRSGDSNALLRTARITSRPAAVSGSLESSDPALRDALARVILTPTTEHYLEAADAYVKQGVRDRAHDYLTRSLSTNGPDARIYDALARLWRDWGQPGEGLGHAHRAVHLAPHSAVAHNTLGTVLYRLGQIADAEASFTQALAVDPRAWYAMANLCHVSMNTGRTRAAIAQCRRAAALRKAVRASE
jgi:Flp pilus assembly protein TadD